jgi:undecaprenyl-diphosphatase
MSKRSLWIGAWIVLFVVLVSLTAAVMAAGGLPILNDFQFDIFLLLYRTHLFLQIFGAITLLGNTAVVIGIMAIVGIALFFSRFHNAYVIGLATALVGAGGTDFVMKTLVGRARPGDPIRTLVETDPSFPSAHATFSMALYGFLAYFLCTHYPKYAPLFIAGASILILLIAFSRLYLGVHWPSDILAGLSLGALWLLIGIAVTKKFLGVQALQVTNPN